MQGAFKLISVCAVLILATSSNAAEHDIPANRLNSQVYYQIHDRSERDGGHPKFPPPTQNDGGYPKFPPPTQNDGGYPKFPKEKDGGHPKFPRSIIDEIKGIMPENFPSIGLSGKNSAVE